MTTTASKPLTNEQVEQFKYRIIFTKDKVSELTKRLLLYLIIKSENFTKPVAISVIESDEISFDEVNNMGRNDMGTFLAIGNHSELNGLLQLAGTNFIFSYHFGFMENGKLNKENQFGFKKDVDKMSYTFWLSPEDWDTNAEVLPFDLNVIKNTKLRSGYVTWQGSGMEE